MSYTPCDDLGTCPYGEGNSMYFCRDNCGLGVDEDDIPEEDDDEITEADLHDYMYGSTTTILS